MSGQFLLDSAALAISLFNAFILFWLGLTVLFNAEHRAWGVLLAVIGLLTGASFFLAHSVILSQGASNLVRGFTFWWHVGWTPLIGAPFAWYLLMLWYTGFWDHPASPLRRRQTPWLVISFLLAAVLFGLLLAANPLPSIQYEASVDVERLPLLGSVPLLVLIYPPFIVLCISLALDALLRPGPSHRVLGDLARLRARPWLMGASLVLLVVSLLVGVIFLWLIQVARLQPSILGLVESLSPALSLLDLLLAALLMVAILLLGQAVVSYEIFSGVTLPRRGFLKQWRSTILLFAALSLLAGSGVIGRVPPVYTVLGLLLLVALAYAVFTRQSFAERERGIRQLRPFVSSQRLFESILTPASPPELDLAAPFAELCREVLGARQAVLAPLGSLAALGVAPLAFPPGEALNLPAMPDTLTSLTSPRMLGVPLDPERQAGFVWAAPLWNERGLTGLLFLGEKRDGAIYSQEEIEIARASGERLADVLASAEMGRRLVALQRQRSVESGELDRRARRALHDEVLPRLHAALLRLGALPLSEVLQTGLEDLSAVHRQISDLLRDLPRTVSPDLAHLGLLSALRRVALDELQGSFQPVAWQVDPQAEARLKDLSPLAAETLYYAGREALRNAARHARPPQGDSLTLIVGVAWREGIEICIQDNGAGLPLPGATPSGSGQGLALHSTLMAVVNGSLSLESAPGAFTRVRLFIPATELENGGNAG